jgi:L-alanine-DL-glutamate epimerase-like enolase superfamily enzyme
MVRVILPNVGSPSLSLSQVSCGRLFRVPGSLGKARQAQASLPLGFQHNGNSEHRCELEIAIIVHSIWSIAADQSRTVDISISEQSMKITAVKTTPLYCELKEPYHWARGVNRGAEIVLLEIETDGGVVGIGEVPGGPNNRAKLAVIDFVRPLLVGSEVHEISRLGAICYQSAFASRGSGSSPRFFAQCFAGIEMALWDAVGKAAGLAVHQLLGGAVHREISYFGFIQGDNSEEVAASAAALVLQGFQVLYLKVGRGEAADLRNVQAVREAIGAEVRLRLDANEAWDIFTTRRMARLLEPFAIEIIEQPLPAIDGLGGMADLRAKLDIPIAADQSVFGVGEVYECCRNRAADLVVLGLHEVGGIDRMRKAAAIAEAASIRICNHGIFESGITTCAANQTFATIQNADDGNQIMNQLLAEDIVMGVDLTPVNGKLSLIDGPGLGFELASDAVWRAGKAYERASL